MRVVPPAQSKPAPPLELPPRLPRRQRRRLHEARPPDLDRSTPCCESPPPFSSSTPTPGSAATTSSPARRSAPANGATASPASSTGPPNPSSATSPSWTSSAFTPAPPSSSAPSFDPATASPPANSTPQTTPPSAASSAATRKSASTTATATKPSAPSCRRKETRGLALIDPPYEAPNEFDRVLSALQDGAARFNHGVYAAWYPIKHRSPVTTFHEAVRLAALPDVVAAEIWFRTPTDPARLNGAGLLVRNPPYGFEASRRGNPHSPPLPPRRRRAGPGHPNPAPHR